MHWTMKRPELGRPAVAAIGLGLAGLAVATWLLSPASPPPAETPPQPPPPASSPPAAAAPAAPPPSAEGLRLYGLLGGGAIIGFPDGRQRFIAIGRDVLPGLRISRIEQQYVVLGSVGGELRLGFDGVRPVEGATAPVSAAPARAAEAAQRDETLSYRLGLEPVRENGYVMGHRVRPGANLPNLQRAGIRPGDVIRSYNGSRMDEERLAELAWTIANSERVEFEVERDGRPMRLVLGDGSRQDDN
jgi:general secretion pathway protein C